MPIETEAIRTLWKHINRQRTKPPSSGERAKSTGDLERRKTIQRKHVDRDISSAKFYTALTRRSGKPNSESYHALTSNSGPLPRLFDCEETKKRYEKRDVRFWEDEVKK